MEGENRAQAGSRDPLADAILLHAPTLYSTWGQQSNPKGSPASAGSQRRDGVRQRGSTRAAKGVPPAPSSWGRGARKAGDGMLPSSSFHPCARSF